MLTKKFFDDNPVKEFSAQRLAYSFLLYDGLEEIASEVSKNILKEAKMKQYYLKKGYLLKFYLK